MTTWHDIAYKHVPDLDHTAELSKKITSGNTILIPDAEGDLIPFTIREDQLYAGAEKTVKQASCVHLYYELADGPVRAYDLTNATPATAISAALAGTRWQAGAVGPELIALTKDFDTDYLNSLEMLRLIEKEFDAQLKFRVGISGAGIAGYYADLTAPDEIFSGKRFEFGRDLQRIEIIVDHSNVKTALFGYALGEEIDPLTGDPLPLTFESIEWAKWHGNPADKPRGQDWVGSEEARKLYGIYDPATGERLHRFGKYESEAESPKELLDATWLIGERYHFRPLVNIEGDVVDLERAKIVDTLTGELVPLAHERIRIGQIAHVIARHKGLLAAVDVKIKRIERHLKEPGRTRITFGDPLPLQSDYVRDIERMADWRDRRRRKLDRGRGSATVTVASEETSAAPWYARYVVRTGAMLNDVFPEILSLLPPAGGHVVFMEGTYPLDGDIVIDRDNVHVKGQGEGTRLVLKVGTAAKIKGIYADGKIGVEIADLSIDGQRGEQGAAADHCGVTLENCGEFAVNGMTARDFQNSGVFIDGCNEGRIAGCALLGCSNNLAAKDSENIIITGNNARYSTGHGMHFDSVFSSVISDNICNETVQQPVLIVQGMFFDSCENNTISDNICNDNSGNGIKFLENKNILVSGNQCSGNQIAGMQSVEIERCTFIGNTCNKNNSHGMVFGHTIIGGAVDYCNIQNNVCANNVDYGILLVSGHHSVVTNNDLRDNGLVGLLDWGSGTIITPGNVQ